MLKVKNLIMFTLVGIAFLQACNSDKTGKQQTTESGLKYTFFHRGEETQEPDSGMIMVFNMVYSTDSDSVLFDTRLQNMPFALPVKDTNAVSGMLADGFNMLRKGDSVEFIVPAEDFFSNTARAPVPGFIKEGSNIKFNIGVEDIMSEEAFREKQMAEMQKQQEVAMRDMEAQMEKDIKTIEDYLKEKNIKAKKTESGLFYTIEKNGSGPEVDQGDAVTVHYSGTLLDGTPFDSSQGGEPITFNVGQGMVIPGWDEGLQELRKGSKATLYIPSPLAYGPRARSEVIAANSILIFDVEVVDVAKN